MTEATFVMTITTTSDNYTFTFRANGTNNGTINWGDTSTGTVTTSNPTHTYTTAGTYQIEFDGTMTSMNYYSDNSNRNLINSVDQLGDVGFTTLAYAFGLCQNLTKIGADTDVISGVVTLSNFATQCISLTELNCANWDVSSCTNFANFISSCRSLTYINTTNWDTSNSTTFYFFSISSALESLDVSNWDVSKVTTFVQFVSNTQITAIDTSNWNTSSLINAAYMFANTSISYVDTRTWDMSNVTGCGSMFLNCGDINVAGIEDWDVSSCISMGNFLSGSRIPTSRYTAVLDIDTGWISRGINSSLTGMNFGDSTYYGSGPHRFWFKADGTPRQKKHKDFIGDYHNLIFSDISEEGIVTNIRTHKEFLERRQLYVEQLLNNISPEDQAEGVGSWAIGTNFQIQ